MAIAVRWTASSTNGTGSCSVTNQATVAGDLLLMVVSNAGATAAQTLTAPAGWSKPLRTDGTTTVDSGTSTTVYAVFYRIADGTEGTTFTFGGGSGSINGRMTCFSGVDNAVPFDVGAPSNSSASATTTLTTPAITTVTDNALVIRTATHKTASTTFTSTTGPTLIGESPHSHVFQETTTTAGTVTAKALTAAASGSYIGNTLALRPAAGAGGATGGGDTTGPGPVTGVAETHTATSVTLSWTNPTDPDFADVVIRRAAGATAPADINSGTAVATVTKPTATYTDAGLPASTQYSYALFARDATGNSSAAATQTVTTAAAAGGGGGGGAGSITGLVVNPGLTAIGFTWTNPGTGYTGVMIRRTAAGTPAPTGPTDGTLVADVAGPATSYADTGLTAATQYNYAFFAHDAVPTYAPVVMPTTQPTTLPNVAPPGGQTKRPVVARGFNKVSGGGVVVPLRKTRQGEAAGFMPGPNLITRTPHPHVGYSNGTVTAHMSRVRHKVLVDGYDLRLVYGNYEQSSATNNYTVAAGVEILPPGGDGTGSQASSTLLQVTWQGQPSLTLMPNQAVLSDPVPWEFVRDQYFCTRNYVRVAAGERFPLSLSYSGTGEGREEGGIDKTISDTISLGTFLNLFAPASASMTPAADTIFVGLPGDSIMATETPLCFAEQVLEKANIPYQNMARAGEAINVNWLNSGSRNRRMKMMNQCTHIISDYGINDLNSGRTAALLQGDMLAFWRLFSQRGMKVFHTTITPKTTSTDNFTTVANQTPFGAEAHRITVNNWLRDGAPITSTTGIAVAAGTSTNVIRAGAVGHPLTGVFDTATTVETALNSGRWRLDSIQSDGLHPNANGQARMQGAIDVSKLVLTI